MRSSLILDDFNMMEPGSADEIVSRWRPPSCLLMLGGAATRGGVEPTLGPDYATASFHPDGTMTITISGYTAHGAWRAVDPGTARFRAVAPLGPAEGQTGWHTLAFDITVAPDGNGLSLDGTYERPTPSGGPSVTTITGSAERLAIDPGP